MPLSFSSISHGKIAFGFFNFECRWGQWARIGAIRFDWVVFKDLIRYVWKGGYPGWEHGQPPDVVLRMQKKLLAQDCI